MDTLRLYTKTDNRRKLKLEGVGVGGGAFFLLNEEMARRGVYKKLPFQYVRGRERTYNLKEGRHTFYEYRGSLASISKKTDKNIEERPNKEYSVHDLSLLSLIESVLVETAENDVNVDTLKIEILLLLIEKEERFQISGRLMHIYKEYTPSIYEYWHFFPVLQGYSFNLAKKLVSEYKHDFLINKEFNGELTLTPTEGYDQIYEYFKED